MSYIEESLVEGERLLHRARLTWWSQSGLLALAVLALAAAAAALVLLPPPDPTVTIALGIAALLGLAFALAAWVRMRSTEVAITSRRIIAKKGFLRRSTVEINLEKVEALRVEQGLTGRFLNYGTIFMSGAGTSVAPIANIADPLVFRRKFMEATNRPLTAPHGDAVR